MDGDVELNIIAVISNRENFAPKTSLDHKRIIEVYECIQSAVTQLTNLGSLQYLKDYIGLMSKLVMKLQSADQRQYSHYVTSAACKLTHCPNGTSFGPGWRICTIQLCSQVWCISSTSQLVQGLISRVLPNLVSHAVYAMVLVIMQGTALQEQNLVVDLVFESIWLWLRLLGGL